MRPHPLFYKEGAMNEDLELMLSNRAFLYRLLWRTFSEEPSSGYLEILGGEHAGQVVGMTAESLPEDASEIVELFATLKERASQRGLEELSSEYVRLFIGPNKLPAPPWASVYLGKEGIMFDEGTLEVRNIYRSFGYLPEAYPKVADDHLAIELAFVSALYGKALDGEQEGDEVKRDRYRAGIRDFLTDHMAAWLEPFERQLAESKHTDGFYHTAVKLAKKLVAVDVRWLARA